MRATCVMHSRSRQLAMLYACANCVSLLHSTAPRVRQLAIAIAALLTERLLLDAVCLAQIWSASACFAVRLC